MKHFSKLKKKLRPSDSANQPSPQPVSGSAAASNSQIAPPSCDQSTGSSLTVPVSSSPANVSPTTPTSEPATVSCLSAEPENAFPSVPEQLWNKAYSILEEKEPDIVQNYQKILSMVQNEWGDSTAPEELQNLEHCKGAKSREMWRLVYCGLEKSKRQAKYKENLSTVIETIENIKGVVDKAVKYSTEAGIAWAGVCLGLEILSNPMKEPGMNRTGIAYVLSRMEWYWNLAELVLLGQNSSASSAALRTNLETQIVDFYKKLLLFQMRSACLYFRNSTVVILRDALKLDDWSGEINTIKDAERLIPDPRMDKKRIQSQKGDPLKESYGWILESSAYKTFIDDPSSRVLWINGPPGKGKTMLLCGIIDELQKGLRPISFFLCQANVKEEDLSSDIAVMRGLIYVLLEHQPSLISAIRPSYDKQKDRLFNSINSSELLGDILTKMLRHPSLHDVILLVDALDECNINRSMLINLIVGLSRSCKTKWIVSSRDWPEIHQELSDATGLISLDLEQEHESVSQAVRSYISKKVDDLAKAKWKNDLELKEKVFDYMQSHADGTFLWVALVCERLANSGIRKRLVMEELVKFPTSLTDLYQAMMDQITSSSEADRLKQILALVCVVYRPIKSAEISTLVEPMAGYDDDDVRDAIASCGSFLILQGGEIFFVHQSAKEFLLDQGHDVLFPRGRSHQHVQIFLRSVEAMEDTLQQDIYELGSPGALNPYEAPSPDPLASIKYSCIYWAQHLCHSESVKEPGLPYLKTVLHFLRSKFTYWLEALSLMKELSAAMVNMMALENILVDVRMQELTAFIRDACRFIANHKTSIKPCALQVYCSALIFSPESSVIRQQFSHHIPNWVAVKPKMDDDWDALIQTIYMNGLTKDATYSPDGCYLALSIGRTSFVYDTASGDILHQEMSDLFSPPLVYSPDGLLLCCAIKNEIAVLHATTFRLIRKLELWADQCLFLPGSNDIALVFGEHVTIFDWKTGERVLSLGPIKKSSTVALLSKDCIATVSPLSTAIKIWDLATGDCKDILDWVGENIDLLACSFDGRRIAASSIRNIRLWDLDDTQSWAHKNDLVPDQRVSCLAFSADNRLLISGCLSGSIRIWDETGMTNQLASGGQDRTVKLWGLSELSSDQLRQKRPSSVQACDHTLQASEQNSCSDEPVNIKSLLFSPMGSMLASFPYGGKTHIWDTETDTCTDLVFSNSPSGRDMLSFTPDDRLVAMRDMDEGLGVWDTESQTHIHCCDLKKANFVAISADGRSVLSFLHRNGVGESELRIWDLTKDAQTQQHITSETLPPGIDTPMGFVYSEDWKVLAVYDLFDDLYILHRKSGYWVNEPFPDIDRRCFDETPMAFSPDREWLLTCKKNPSSFVMRKPTYPYLRKQLGSLEADDPPHNTSHLEEPWWRIATQYGFLGIGKPCDFEGTARIGWGLSIDMAWVMRGNERMLWIPAEYRRAPHIAETTHSMEYLYRLRSSIEFRARGYNNAGKSPPQLKMSMIIRVRLETICILIDPGAYPNDRSEVNLVYKEGLAGSLISWCGLILRPTPERFRLR
ncbi:hypothetical protein FGADI_5980 [Fusarium gaditjirri]|uniref:NACHT domain-containing protein n=1 Tax=Fusarium gaditjirri TaxID=282569 RepID=A0A8H4WXP2_9HYPO|nr:hypothetical protein FGADI_5980 [Fusarium gaditjirri]